MQTLINSYNLLLLIKNNNSNGVIKRFVKNNKIQNINYLFYIINYTNDTYYLDYLLELLKTIEYDNSLDTFILFSELIIHLKKFNYSKNTIILYKQKIADIFNSLKIDETRIIDDPYILGEYLKYCYKIKRLFNNKIIKKKDLLSLYHSIINKSLKSLRKLRFNAFTINNDMYKWFNLCIGLEAIKILKFKNNNIKIKQLLEFYYLKNKINNNAIHYSYRTRNWNKHLLINKVIYENMFYPIL